MFCFYFCCFYLMETIEDRDGWRERESGKSVLSARLDDDDDDEDFIVNCQTTLTSDPLLFSLEFQVYLSISIFVFFLICGCFRFILSLPVVDFTVNSYCTGIILRKIWCKRCFCSPKTEFKIDYGTTYIQNGGAHDTMVIVIGNGHGELFKF